MQTHSESWNSDYQKARTELQQYYKDTEKDGFAFGCNNFPPFIHWNGQQSGPLLDLMRDAALDLGVPPHPVDCHWNDFAERLANGDYASVAAPIMPIHQRAFRLVLIGRLRCGALLFNKGKVGAAGQRELHHRTRGISSCLRDLATVPPSDTARADELIGNVEDHFRSIGHVGSGLAAGQFYFEHFLLQRFNAPISSDIPGAALAEGARARADDGFICAIDITSLRGLETALGAEFRSKYEFMPVLGRYIWMPAGLPFVRREVGIYLWARWRHDISGTRSKVVRELEALGDSDRLTPTSFEFIDVDAMPDGLEATATTRNLSYARGIAQVLDAGFGETLSARLRPLDDVVLVTERPLSKELPMGSAGANVMRQLLDAVDRNEVPLEAVQISMQEADIAQRYIIRRYQSLVDKKHLSGLTGAQEEELAQLSEALDDIDEPFYERVFARLRNLGVIR
jgi:hypothetical protein